MLDLIDGDDDNDDSEYDDAYDARGYSPLELNAITIMPTSAAMTEAHNKKGKKPNLGRSSQLFDVHDGQQRLVSICLIFAALRDNFLEWGEEWEEDAMEISQAIYPKKSRLEDVARIQLKERREESVMHRILSNEWIHDHDTDSFDNDSDHEGRLFYKNYPKYYTAKERKSMPKSELYILEAYEYLNDRVKELKPRRAIKFLDALKDDTFLLVCIPSSTRMARSIVMGLGKGKVGFSSTSSILKLFFVTFNISSSSFSVRIWNQWMNLKDLSVFAASKTRLFKTKSSTIGIPSVKR